MRDSQPRPRATSTPSRGALAAALLASLLAACGDGSLGNAACEGPPCAAAPDGGGTAAHDGDAPDGDCADGDRCERHLALWLPFEEGRGATAADRSGHDNHAALEGASFVGGTVGSHALGFDGVDDHAEVADAPSLDATEGLTLEAWVHPAASGQTAYLVSKNVDYLDGMTYSLRLHEGQVRLVLDDVDHFPETPFVVPIARWTHLAATWDGATVRLYANGEPIHTAAHAGPLTPNDAPVVLGARSHPTDGHSHHFAGALDELRVATLARTASDVCAAAGRSWDGSACAAADVPEACGDGTCGAGEECATCEADCGTCDGGGADLGCGPGGDQLCVFPGARGFGTETVAGRGGAVHRVTSLGASGDGSLAACLGATGPRVCVFEVSGTIRLDRALRIRDPYVTVAGQTAPSPGILLRGAGIGISTHDVLVQHLRVRVGDAADGPTPENRDGLHLGSGAHRVVLDHMSFSWAIDENTSTWGSTAGVWAEDVTLSNSFVTEALHESLHPKGGHSMGLLVGRLTRRASVVGCLFAHNNGRNPLVRDDVDDVVIVNNLVYDPGAWVGSRISFGTFGDGRRPVHGSVVGNGLVRGPDSGSDDRCVYVHADHAAGSRIYLEDNACPVAGSDPWSVARNDAGGGVRAADPPVWPAGLVAWPSAEVEARVLAHAGARPADRDAVDERIVREVTARTGGIIDSQDEVGGWPVLAENRRPFVAPADPSGDDDGDGYTNLEETLHAMAAALER